MKRLIVIIVLWNISIRGQEHNTDVEKNKGIMLNIPSKIRVDISGEVEFEFIDVEGSGGAKNKNENFQKVKTRSPHARIDKAVLKLNFLYSKNLNFKIDYRFNDINAYVDKSYLIYNRNNAKLEIGRNKPLIASNRQTEAYPLIGTSYWRAREYHIDLQKQYKSSTFGASISLKRPLGYKNALEDESYKILVYGNMPNDQKGWDGVTFEYGLRNTFNLYIFKISSWGYYGKLYDDYEWKSVLEEDLNGIEIENTITNNPSLKHFWYGGRGEFNIFGFLSKSEYIYSMDGFLIRDGFYTEIGRPFVLSGFPENSFHFIARYGQINIHGNNNNNINHNWKPKLEYPYTWELGLITLAINYNIHKKAKIRVEYYITKEKTGDTLDKASLSNRPYQPTIKDNQLLIQFELKF